VGLIVDSNVFIRYERTGRSEFFTQYTAEDSAYISAITVSELLVGVYLADTAARRSRRLAFVEGLLRTLPVLDFNAETARSHAEIYASLRRQGILIGAHDLMIAATALQHGCAVLTGNEREFRRVPGLKVLAV
jgi:predicted nucleic acid-binding protein